MGGTNKKLTLLSGSITCSDRLAYNALLLPLLLPALWLLPLLKDVIFYITFFLSPVYVPFVQSKPVLSLVGLEIDLSYQ